MWEVEEHTYLHKDLLLFWWTSVISFRHISLFYSSLGLVLMPVSPCESIMEAKSFSSSLLLLCIEADVHSVSMQADVLLMWRHTDSRSRSSIHIRPPTVHDN